MSEPTSHPLISVIIPAHNEAGNLPTLVEKIVRGAKQVADDFEIVLVDDGSTDDTRSIAHRLTEACPRLKVLRNAQKSGISASVTRGIKEARGDILIFLPADLQSDPEEDIPKLVSVISDDVDVVAGYRKGRADGREQSSLLYNWAVRRLFSVEGRDLNWIKASKRQFIADIELRAGWYRLLVPILVARGARMAEVETNWHPRIHGRSKFSPFRFIPFLWDIVAVRFLVSQWNRNFDSFLLYCGLILSVVIAMLWGVMGYLQVGPVWPLGFSIAVVMAAAALYRALMVVRRYGLGAMNSPESQEP